MRIPAEAPLKNVVTMPVGTMLASSRSDMRSGTTSGGLLEAESTTGISEAETRTDARRKSFTPSGSATSSRNCPIVMPPIVTIMYLDRSRPRVAFVARSLSHDSSVT